LSKLYGAGPDRFLASLLVLVIVGLGLVLVLTFTDTFISVLVSLWLTVCEISNSLWYNIQLFKQ
jgi:hypothetical protein